MHSCFAAAAAIAAGADGLIIEVHPDPSHAVSDGKQSLRPETFAEIQSLLEPGLGTYIYGPGGCEQCRHQGYLGRIGVFEIMTFNRQLRKLVLDARPAEELQNAAIAAGMVEFRRAAMLKVAQGITSMEEVLREPREPR